MARRTSKQKKIEQNRKQEAFKKLFRKDAFKKLTVIQKNEIVLWTEEFMKERERLAMVDGYESGMIDTAAVMIQILRTEYWRKSPNKKFGDLLESMIDLQNKKLCGTISWQQEIDFIKRYTGVNYNSDWVGKAKYPTLRHLFELEEQEYIDFTKEEDARAIGSGGEVPKRGDKSGRVRGGVQQKN